MFSDRLTKLNGLTKIWIIFTNYLHILGISKWVNPDYEVLVYYKKGIARDVTILTYYKMQTQLIFFKYVREAERDESEYFPTIMRFFFTITSSRLKKDFNLHSTCKLRHNN